MNLLTKIPKKEIVILMIPKIIIEISLRNNYQDMGVIKKIKGIIFNSNQNMPKIYFKIIKVASMKSSQ